MAEYAVMLHTKRRQTPSMVELSASLSTCWTVAVELGPRGSQGTESITNANLLCFHVNI